MTTGPRKIDTGFYAIVTLLGVVVIWLLLTPVVPAISMATMRRFHLGSGSFARWAWQFPIPAMYNFANQFQLRGLPPELVDSLVDESATQGYVNHFPARVVTFADGRYRNLRSDSDRWVTLRSDYRGHSLETRWHMQYRSGQYVLVRLGAEESP